MEKLIFTLAVLALLLGGCAREVEPEVRHQPTPAVAALVFTPEAVRGVPVANLDRSGREPAAFGGVVRSRTTFNVTLLDDLQRSGRFGSYDLVRRRTLSTRVEVIQR
jgi:PBP1b-binding outer membrane lipoprotein LpoB